MRMFVARGRAMQEVPGGAVPCEVIQQEIKNLEAQAVAVLPQTEANSREIAISVQAETRETR